jgi:lipooligosaccharide transport system permease protein
VQDVDTAVSYLVFVAPALLATATISVAARSSPTRSWRASNGGRYFGLQRLAAVVPQIVTASILGAPAHGRRRRRVLRRARRLRRGAAPRDRVARGAAGVLAARLRHPAHGLRGSIEDDKGQFALVQRFIFMPMFLFSGTFYPLDSLPLWLQWIGWISPLWHGAELGRASPTARRSSRG